MEASDYEPAATPDEAIAGLEATRNAIWQVDAIAGLTLRADVDDDEFEPGLIQACMANVRQALGPCCERIDKAIEMLDGSQLLRKRSESTVRTASRTSRSPLPASPRRSSTRRTIQTRRTKIPKPYRRDSAQRWRS